MNDLTPPALSAMGAASPSNPDGSHDRRVEQARKAYLDLADAVCKESASVEDACQKARTLRSDLAAALSLASEQTKRAEEREASSERHYQSLMEENAALQARHARVRSALEEIKALRFKWPDWSSSDLFDESEEIARAALDGDAAGR